MRRARLSCAVGATCALALLSLRAVVSAQAGASAPPATPIAGPIAGPTAAPTAAPTQTAGSDPTLAPAPDAGADALPAEHEPTLAHTLEPGAKVAVGARLRLTITADALAGDDVTVPEQSFEPFELIGKQARVEQEKNGKQRFVFVLDMIGLTAGEQELSPIDLRVVTQDGTVGATKLPAIAIEVTSLLGNEPNAALKEPTKPVVVMQDDYTLAYVLGGLLGAAAIAALTLLAYRYWQRRVRPPPPPPPPRPAWEVALEKLSALRQRKAQMIAAGNGALFVDEASDIIRELLGGTFGFVGLDTTSEEMLLQLRRARARSELLLEVQVFLGRCDLVKFAKLEPDQDEVELVLAKAQALLELSMPRATAVEPMEQDGSA